MSPPISGGRSEPESPNALGSAAVLSSSVDRWSAPANAVNTGTSPSMVASAQPARSTHTLRMPSVPAMPVVSATVTCAARTTSSKLLRVAASITGSVVDSPVSGSAVATAVAT